MKPKNRIHQLAFDVNFAATPADEQALPVWIQENLLPVIDQVIQQLSEQTEHGSTKVRRVKRLEKLEIDLGTVTQTESATELQRRLHSQLLNALTFELAEKSEASLQEQRAYAQKTQLLDFLRTGQLSWRSEQHGKHAHKHLLNKLLTTAIGQPVESLDRHTRFEESLSQITKDDLQLTRLVRQFDTPELFQIIKGHLPSWSSHDQELILDWVSLELLGLSNLSRASSASAALNTNSKSQQQERFWKYVLRAIQQPQSCQSLIMSWMTQRQQTLEHALNYYRQAIVSDATLSNSTRVALNLVLNNFHQQLSTAHVAHRQYKVALTKGLAWSDTEVDALRELIIASRAGVHHFSIEDFVSTLEGNRELNTSVKSNGNTASEATICALKIADFEALAAQWQHLLFYQTELIRTLQKSVWQLWLRNFKPVQILELACVLQTNCAWFISRHQHRIIELAPAEREHLLTQLLASKPDSLTMSDLLNSPRLASCFEAQAMQRMPIERAEPQYKSSEKLKPSSDDLERVLKAWPVLLQKPETLLAVFYRHKQTYLHSLPISHLLEVAQIAYPEIFQIWQVDLHLIATIKQHSQHESSLRTLLQSLFSINPDTITPHAFIAMLSTLLTKNANAGFMLQWINAISLSNNHDVPQHSLPESALEQNLASTIQATLNAAIESCLQTNVSSLFKLRPTHWRHWLVYAGETQQLQLARQFQGQLSDFFSMLERLSQPEKSATLSSALPLLLATLPGESKLVQLISSLRPDLQEAIKNELLTTHEAKNFEENDTRLLATRTPNSSVHVGDEMIDEEVNLHEKNSSISDLLFEKNSNDFKKILPTLLQRGQDLAQFWLELQKDQQEQFLIQLDFDSKVDLLALLYPELALGLHQTISLLKNAALSPVENSKFNEGTKRQSSSIDIRPTTDGNHRLKNFVIAIDKILVSGKHNATSANEIVNTFSKLFQTRSFHAENTQELNLARQFQTQLDDRFPASALLGQAEKNSVLNFPVPLTLTALPGELRLIQLISDPVPSLLDDKEDQLSPANKSETLVENTAQLLAPRTTSFLPRPRDEKLDVGIDDVGIDDVGIDVHQQSESKSDIFFRKNANDFRKKMSNLTLQRSQEIALFWRHLQPDQREQRLVQLDVDSKLDLLALLYPELSQELHHAIHLLKNSALSPSDNSRINENLKRLSSDIGIRPTISSSEPLKNFLITIDNMLVSDMLNATTVKEVVKEFANSLWTMLNEPHQVSLEQIQPSQKSPNNTEVDARLNPILIAEANLSDKLDTIWSALLTSTTAQTTLDKAANSHLLNPLLHGFRSWQSGYIALSQLRLTVEELEQYLHWWILQQTRSDSDSPPENYALMLNSIKKAAQQCTHPETFMQLVLDDLRDDQALDLEMLKIKAATMLMSTTNTTLNRRSNALTSMVENEDFLLEFGKLSYDKSTIEQEFSLTFDFNSHMHDRAEIEQSHRIFIQQFFLALNDAQQRPALFSQLRHDPSLLKFLNTAQLHQLLIARVQNATSNSLFAKMSSDMNSDSEPHQLLNRLERQAYYSEESRDFLLAVWHKLNVGDAFYFNKSPELLQKIETDYSDFLYQTTNLSSLFSATDATRNKKKDGQNFKQTLTTIFKARHVTTDIENERKTENASEVSITSNLSRNEQAGRTLSQSQNKGIVEKSEDTLNQTLKISTAKYENVVSQIEFIQWFQSIQSDLKNQAFNAWTIEWLSAHAQSAPHHVFGYEAYTEAEAVDKEDHEEKILLQPENFSLILSLMHQVLPTHLYERWQGTAISVFSIDEGFWEKLSQHPFQSSSALYQACSTCLINSLADTTWVNDRVISSSQKETNAFELKSAPASPLTSQLAMGNGNTVSSLPLQTREALPHKLAQAILVGHLQSLDLIWDEIRLHHVDLLRQAQSRYLNNLSLREKLILNNPVNRILDLIAALSPNASVCLRELWQAWDICRRHLNPTMDLNRCQGQSNRAAFSYLLGHPDSGARSSAFLENVLLQLLDAKIDAKFLPDLLRTCLKDLNADQGSQSSQLLLAMHEITQKHLLLQNLYSILDWHETPFSEQIDPINLTSVIASTFPILNKAHVQNLFVHEICTHAPQLIEYLFPHIIDGSYFKESTQGAEKTSVEALTVPTSATKLAKINVSDYPSILNAVLRSSTENAQEKFWCEYGVQLQRSANTIDLLQAQESALNKSLSTLFAMNRADLKQFVKKDDSSRSKIQNTSRRVTLPLEFEKNGEGIQVNPLFSFDKLSLLLQTRRDLSLPEQRYLTLSLSRLHASDKLAWANLVSALKDAFSLERYLQFTTLHDLDRLFSLLRPELAIDIKDIIKKIEIVFDLPLLLNTTLLKPATWRTIYRAEFVGAQAHHYQDFLIKLFSELAHGSAHSLGHNHTLPSPDICLQKLNTYKSEPSSSRSNTDDAIENTANEAEKIKNDAVSLDKNKSNGSNSSDFLNHESHVLNAGMVIVAPYAQRLFGILELTQNGSFVSDEAAQRAVHLLQYVVTGETHTPEFQLTLNKLLCGIHGGIPIVAGITITEHEQEVIEQMLKGVITHWSALGNTSIQGLRETFLRRQGYLYFEEVSWKLKISQGGFDMLLDQLPWSFAMIKFPWMQEPLHVTWR